MTVAVYTNPPQGWKELTDEVMLNYATMPFGRGGTRADGSTQIPPMRRPEKYDVNLF